MMHFDDTIVALATAPGIGAIAVIRLSGQDAISIVNRIFPSKDLNVQPSHTCHVGFLRVQQEWIDEVVVTIFRNPTSYTGEDLVEISCHGSPFIQERVLQLLIAEGARLARPGEFTQRAFLHGKMDLAQAESVADLIASNTEEARRSALQHMRGGFSKTLRELREQLIQFSALIELELDFSQEDVEFADRTRLKNLLSEAQMVVGGLLDSFQLGNVIRKGVSVAITGKPNAGKSTLLNVMLQENRAIVSEIAGTTRDTIEEILTIEGIQFRLMDTAGIRDTDDRIESIGVEKSLEKMEQADLVLYLFDVSETAKEELEAARWLIESKNNRYILVGNKADLPGNWPEKFAGEDVLFISAQTEFHVPVLSKRLVDQVLQGQLKTEGTLVTNVRHVEALGKVRDSLLDIVKGMESGLPGDLLALDIRRALHFLGEITGEVTHEDQLDYIFSKFCIGK